MRKLFSLLVLTGAFTTAAWAQPATTDLNWTPTAKFNKTEHNFGTIAEGPKVTTEFTFTNTGKEPIVVQNAKAGCGCTTPEWDKKPIPPGKTGKIKVGYDSKGRPGTFNKEVDVTFVSGMNQEKTGNLKLTIKGDVKAGGAAPASKSKKGS